MADIPRPPASTTKGGHAVVIGGSIAGLLAARALADHFDEVTVFDRDVLSDEAEPRRGVPQGRHVHSVWNRGLTLMEDFFPGLTADLRDGGAVDIDMTMDFAWYHRGLWKLRVPTGIMFCSQTRPFLEGHIRRRVRALPNVRLRDRSGVTGFTADADRVTGVLVRASGANAQRVPADLVIDASGRGSKTPDWLVSLGYSRPTESVVKIDVGYATRFYRRPPHESNGYKALIVMPTPPSGRRLGVAFPVEGQRWIVMLGGWHSDYPPSDDESFLAYARDLEAPHIHELISTAEPLTSIVTHRFPANVRRHYERLRRFPGGLIVLGDALCSFNPIYGQGMTVSAMEAATLRECLERRARSGDGFDAVAARFRKRAPKRLDAPWRLAAGEDHNWPETQGAAAFGTAFMNWYFGRVHTLAAHDPEVLTRFVRIANMLDSPIRIFHPRVAARVFTRLPN